MTLGSDPVCEFPTADVSHFEPATSATARPAQNTEVQVLDAWYGAAYEFPSWPQVQPGLSRLIDVVGAATILIITLPFLTILAVILYLDSPGPLLFVQQRIGRGGRQFPCMKFRTMCRDADVALQQHLATSCAARTEWQRDHKLRNDPRITRLGAIIRKLSLDEFPQLVNIIRGEMSLVGPRPIVRAEVERYGRYFEKYCQVRPGLTGLWQVSGRNDLSYRRRVSIDCFYVRNKSLLLDMAILARTVPVVVGSRGSY